ncbi:unnamed protein product [Rotaria sordida]|uniref:Uncharacterized protein n=1 Tax=Rotaria sordida TaxID=392033 RepID=A0A819VNU3_9BILA|nr:unnamed protein product [Rotaria sordida]CAF1053293.1 unnamed protein product [Rotaria sordida]CAF4111795.1 unnamed protein product [Rotaria sordida]
MTKESSEQSQSGIKIYTSNPWNLIKSGFLVLTWIVLGIHLELVGPTMGILASNANIDYSGMGSALASRGAGYLIANICGAFLQNIVKKHSEGILVCAFILAAIAVFGTSLVTSLILMCILFFIQGAAQGLTDLGGTNILLTMWGAHAAAPLNTAHLGYGIGAVIANLLVRPFLSQRSLSKDTTNNTKLNETFESVHSIPTKNSSIVVPYSITAVLCLLIAVGHLFFYIREQKSQRERLEIQQVDYTAVSTNPLNTTHTIDKDKSSPYSPRTCGRGFFQYGLILSIIFVIYTFFIGGNDQTFSKFFFSYVKQDKLNISTQGASWATILYWLSYSIGRLIAAIISVFLSVDICLNIVWCGGFCLALAWLIFVWVIGLTSTSLFILGSATGLVFSPIFPLSFGYFNQKLNVVPMLLALLLCGSAVGTITLQKIAGFVMDRNPKHFPTLLIVCLLMSIIFYLISYVIYSIHKRKNLSNPRPSVTGGAALSPENFNEEEQQMATYLRDNQDT